HFLDFWYLLFASRRILCIAFCKQSQVAIEPLKCNLVRLRWRHFQRFEPLVLHPIEFILRISGLLQNLNSHAQSSEKIIDGCCDVGYCIRHRAATSESTAAATLAASCHATAAADVNLGIELSKFFLQLLARMGLRSGHEQGAGEGRDLALVCER